MKYAVNIADMTAWAQGGDLNPVMVLVQPTIDRDAEPIMASGKRWDEMAVPFKPDVTEERIEAIIKLLRAQLKVQKHHLRIYASKNGNGGWKRV